MKVARLIEQFHDSIAGHHPNDWELEEYLRPLAALDPENQQLILSQVPILWPVSHALCFNYLATVADVLDCLEPQQFADWVKGLLDAYEAEGLRAAQHFMDDVEKNFLCKIRGETGLRLERVQTRLLSYIQGISGNPLALESGCLPLTDTAKIVLPEELNFFPDESKNFLFYKFAATVQCGHLHFGTYRLQPEDRMPLLDEIAGQSGKAFTAKQPLLVSFFDLFDHPQLAADLFWILQNWRIVRWIKASYPGLYYDVQPLLADIFQPFPVKASMTRQDVMTLLNRFLHAADPRLLRLEKRHASLPLARIFRVLEQCGEGGPAGNHILNLVWSCYRQLSLFEGDYRGLPQSSIFGVLDCKGAHFAIQQRRKEDKKKFVHMLAALLKDAAKKAPRPQSSEPAGKTLPGENGTEEGALLLLAAEEEGRQDDLRDKASSALRFLTVGGKEIALSEEMRQLVSRISSDFGGLPVQYISSAAGLAGQGPGSMEEVEHEPQQIEPLQGSILYDEWDFRRKGYKKEWCHVLEKKVQQVTGSFVGKTLEKHRGLLLKLRRQFETMRNQQQLMKGSAMETTSISMH